MIITWLFLLTACGQTREQTVETAGQTENILQNSEKPRTDASDTNYQKMKEEQPKHKRKNPEPSSFVSPLPEKETLLPKESPDPGEYDLQLVFIGDETLEREDDGTGIPELCTDLCKAHGYCLTVSGTGVATEDVEILGDERWSSRCLAGVIKAVKGEVSTELFDGTPVYETLCNMGVDLSKTDYFVIAYGSGDFRHGISLDNRENDYDLRTYAGALRYAISSLRERYPGAEIVLCSPYYCQFYRDGWMIGDSNIYDQGKGTLRDYMGTCEYIAGEQQVLFFNAYDDLGIDGYTADDDLQEGIHLTDRAKNRYADLLAGLILANEEQKNN